MDWIFRHSWIALIVVTCLNAATLWKTAKKEIQVHPELEAGYRTIVRGIVLWGNLPWLVMGAGILFGGVPTVFHFFNPRNGPYVIAWYVTVVVDWLAAGYWIFFKGGADALIRHPGLFNVPIKKPWVVKALFVAAVAGGAGALSMMILGDIPAP